MASRRRPRANTEYAALYTAALNEFAAGLSGLVTALEDPRLIREVLGRIHETMAALVLAEFECERRLADG